MQRQQQHVQYMQPAQPTTFVHSSAPPAMPRQFVQTSSGPVYQAAPPVNNRQYVQVPTTTTSNVMVRAPPTTTENRTFVTTTQPATTENRTFVTTTQPAAEKKVTTTVVRTTDDADRIVEITPIRVEGPMAANAFLAGFLLLWFDPDRNVSNLREARILALQLVAFGCFLSACCFHGMYLQRGRLASMRTWVYSAQLLSYIGMILLISAVAMSSRMQLGEEYRMVWVLSITTMLVLVLLPIICDIGFCISRLVMSALDWF